MDFLLEVPVGEFFDEHVNDKDRISYSDRKSTRTDWSRGVGSRMHVRTWQSSKEKEADKNKKKQIRAMKFKQINKKSEQKASGMVKTEHVYTYASKPLIRTRGVEDIFRSP